MNQTETKTVWTDAWPVFQIEWVQSAWRIRKTIDVDIDRWPAAMKQRLYSEYLTEIARIELSGIPPLRMAANLVRRSIDYEVRKQIGGVA